MGRVLTARERLASRRKYEVLHGERFDGDDLASVCLRELRLTRCSFRGADLRHATLDGCGFKLCDFHGADLRGASLRGVSFAGCDLTGADLRGADLTGAHFGRVLTGTPPHGLTDITGARLDHAVLRDLPLDQVVGRAEPGGVRPGVEEKG
ncbi:pentapeptide repeat-containing protein [Streptomyces sp. NPDC003656]